MLRSVIQIFVVNYFFYSIAILFTLSCNSKTGKTEEEPVTVLMVQPTANNIAIKNAITDIATREFATVLKNASPPQINGMEAMKISLKEYYTDQRNNQQIDFKKYMDYLDRFATTKNPISTHSSRSESRAKHDAAIKYLDKLIYTSTDDKTVYKVIYYLNVTINGKPFNQLKTTYLDEQYNKMSMDYSHLK